MATLASVAFVGWGAAAVSARVAIDWASHPVEADETVLLLGGTFSETSVVTVAPHTTTTSGIDTVPLTLSSNGNRNSAAVAVPVVQASEGSIKFVLPAAQPAGQWDVSVDGSAPFTLNAPEPWWVMGDRARTATPGGWLRVFGACVFHQSAAAASAQAELTAAEAALAAQAARLGNENSDSGGVNNTNSASMLAAELLAAAERVAQARERARDAVGATASTLRLTPTTTAAAAAANNNSIANRRATTSPVLLTSDPDRTTRWGAWFDVPSSLPPGNYDVAVANALDPNNFSPLKSFVSPAEPAVSSVTVCMESHLHVICETVELAARMKTIRGVRWTHPPPRAQPVSQPESASQPASQRFCDE
jgi:hypothetical protein